MHFDPTVTTLGQKAKDLQGLIFDMRSRGPTLQEQTANPVRDPAEPIPQTPVLNAIPTYNELATQSMYTRARMPPNISDAEDVTRLRIVT